MQERDNRPVSSELSSLEMVKQLIERNEKPESIKDKVSEAVKYDEISALYYLHTGKREALLETCIESVSLRGGSFSQIISDLFTKDLVVALGGKEALENLAQRLSEYAENNNSAFFALCKVALWQEKVSKEQIARLEKLSTWGHPVTRAVGRGSVCDCYWYGSGGVKA